MRGVEFHTGLADPLAFACRLLRKAQRQANRLLVTAPDERLAELDALLWCFDADSFVPHVRWPGASPAVLARTPIWLCVQVPADLAGLPPTLINLGADVAPDLTPFKRVIELVSHDVDEAQAGRIRWRTYKAQGLQIVHHAASSVSAAQG